MIYIQNLFISVKLLDTISIIKSSIQFELTQIELDYSTVLLDAWIWLVRITAQKLVTWSLILKRSV